MTKTVLVTGATGFVGSHLARQLCDDGYRVRILRRASSKLDAIKDLPLEHVIGDLFDEDALSEQLRGVDWVFHVAAVSNYWRSDKASIYRVNVDGTRHLLRAAERAEVRRFIFTSSAAAIGWHPGRVADESTYFNVDPGISPYGHSKFLAEAEVLNAVQRGLDAVMLNPAVVMGPGDLNEISGSLVTEVARGKLFAMPQVGGTNFIDVRDVARAHIAAAEKGRTGERYIIGAVNMTHKAMTRLICDVVGISPPLIPAPGFVMPIVAMIADLGRALGIPLPVEGNQLRLSRRRLYWDCSKMWHELHQPQIDIRQSLQDTFDWYKANGYI